MFEIDDLKHDIARHVAICSDQATRITELEARLDAEMRLSGDLEAALRFVASELRGGPLAAYIETELKRLSE